MVCDDVVAVVAEDEHHESDADEDATLSTNVTVKPSSLPATVVAARTSAFDDNDTSSEVNIVFSLVFLLLVRNVPNVAKEEYMRSV